MAKIHSVPCPDCGSTIIFKFALITNLGLGIVCFARCEYCFRHGDTRSAKLFVEFDEATYRTAYALGLPVLKYNLDTGDEEEEDSENIIEELDDDPEEYSRSDIGFKGGKKK